jgi:hypothetical protein
MLCGARGNKAKGAYRRTRPFGQGTSGRQGIGQGNGRIAQEGAGLEDESGRGDCHGQ